MYLSGYRAIHLSAEPDGGTLRKHWEEFRILPFACAVSCALMIRVSSTENEWRGTHLGTFLGWPATGKPVKMRAIVVWHFKGDELWGETIFLTNGSLLKQIGAKIEIPPPVRLNEASLV